MFSFKILKCNCIYLDSLCRHALIHLDTTSENLALDFSVMCTS